MPRLLGTLFIAMTALVVASPLGAASAANAPAHAARAAASIYILSVTSPARRRSDATLTARVSPNGTMCKILILYKSGPSRASGVVPKRVVNNRVSWTWMVGSNTTGGTWPIYVECGSSIAKTQFTVTG